MIFRTVASKNLKSGHKVTYGTTPNKWGILDNIMETIFTKIIKREIPAEIIYEDEFSLVIPDKFPSMPGQLVVISKRQVS